MKIIRYFLYTSIVVIFPLNFAYANNNLLTDSDKKNSHKEKSENAETGKLDNVESHHGDKHRSSDEIYSVGSRPYFLTTTMLPSKLKRKLESCKNKPIDKTVFSIGHRGAPLQFPEHTQESYTAASRMGAGMVECDVTFTADKELVCRHSQCDLHTTTNILETELAEKCSTPFTPAQYDSDGTLLTSASAQCCTSDITLAEFKTLKGKMDAANSGATTVKEYLAGTASWRTDLYAASRGTLLSHRESIWLFKKLGVKMTPELKAPTVPMPFKGMTQADYAQKMIDEYKSIGVSAGDVWPQSFNYIDVIYWLENEPRFARQAVFLDGRDSESGFNVRDPNSWDPSMSEIAASGINIIAPPMWMLLDVKSGKIVESLYAKEAKLAGLDIITWTLERSGPLLAGGGYYYQTLNGLNPDLSNPQDSVIDDDGKMYEVLDILAKDVGILGVFSDWPATVSYYANCMGLE
tara:strand:+ start:470 stop:1861 length:1392 start_codon:yes stop_codon:yes gene_type:complete